MRPQIVEVKDPNKFVYLHSRYHAGGIAGLELELASGATVNARIVACHPELRAFSVVPENEYD